ncbi:DUF3159 domain-containing protein [Aeromicrobium panaciterrae]|uniref:DUF3159 domain-containing protein n=1 Tax=Aeromicrobium panaciterrae TaxID=363861 RepID=UPI0031CE7A6C
MTASAGTVEQLVRARLAIVLGGRRGVAESAAPIALFTLCWITTHDLKVSLGASIVAAVALLLVRVVQRSSVQFVVNALFGIGIAAVFAARSGEARDVFLPGILLNGGYAAAMIFSIVIGWPVVGFMIGSLVGDPTEWHRDKPLVKLCSQLTWVLALPCLIRVAVQYPLYVTDHVALLGTAKLALGWPLQLASFAAMAWLLGRNRTPADPETVL